MMQKFAVAELLVKAGADPWFACPQSEGGSLTAPQAVVAVINPGLRTFLSCVAVACVSRSHLVTGQISSLLARRWEHGS